MPAPTRELPIWADTADFPEILDENLDPVAWSEQPTKEPTGMDAVAEQGHIPDTPTDAEHFNDWLWLASSVVNFLRDESDLDKFGDGEDGDVTLSTAGTTTLTRDMYYNNLTISHASRIVEAAGFRIFVRGTLTITAGTIQNNGVDAVDENGGNGAPTRGSQTMSTFLLGGGDGADGPTGNAEDGNQADALLLRLGGAGGAGGASGGGQAGGASQGGSLPAPTRGGFRHFPACIHLRDLLPVDSGTPRLIGGGVGGSSGGNEFAGGGGHGGAGGGGGGVIVIVARRIVLSASAVIRANGGDASVGVGGAGGAGGGGGGGGGLIVIVARELSDDGATIEVEGGAGAAGGGAGSPVAGDPGSDGDIILLAA